jgi:hypothetical protein
MEEVLKAFLNKKKIACLEDNIWMKYSEPGIEDYEVDDAVMDGEPGDLYICIYEDLDMLQIHMIERIKDVINDDFAFRDWGKILPYVTVDRNMPTTCELLKIVFEAYKVMTFYYNDHLYYFLIDVDRANSD